MLSLPHTYWEIILHVVLAFLHILGSEAVMDFVCNDLLEEICMVNALGHKDSISMQSRVVDIYCPV